MDSIYTIEDLKLQTNVVKNNVHLTKVNVPVLGQDNQLVDTEVDDLISILEDCRDRQGSNAALIATESALDTLQEIIEASAAASAPGSPSRSRATSRAAAEPTNLQVAIAETLEMPSNAITEKISENETTIEVLISVPFLADEAKFSGLATEEEIIETRSRSASVVSPKNYVANLNLDEKKKYYIYISANYTSNNAPGIVDGMERIWLCGECPSYMPNNFIYFLPKIAENASAEDRLRIRAPFGQVDSLIESFLQSDELVNIYNALIDRQGKVWIKGYSTLPCFSRILLDGVSIFGLSIPLSVLLDNKVKQIEILRDHVPLPNVRTMTIAECADHFDSIASPDGVFLALETGSAGSGTFHIKTKDDMISFASLFEENPPVNMAEWLTLTSSVSVDIIIASADEVIVYGIIDQVYDSVRGMQCMGSDYPAKLDQADVEKVLELSTTIGKTLAEKTGVRGYISIDLSHDGPRDTWYFVEVNARYPGSVSERLSMMEACRSASVPSVMELELMAIRDGTFNGNSLWEEPSSLYWSRRRILCEANFELSNTAITEIREKLKGAGVNYIEEVDEMKLFQTALNDKSGIGIFGFLEGGSLCHRSACLGKIVAVAANEEERNRLLITTKEIIESVLPIVSYGS